MLAIKSAAEIEVLVSSVQGLAVDIANKLHKTQHGAYDLEDVIQAALVGAASAARDYDPEHSAGASFATFAIHRMRQEAHLLYFRNGVTKIPKREYQEMEKSERHRHFWHFEYISRPLGQDSTTTLADVLPAEEVPDDLFKFAVQKTVKHLLMSLSPAERDMLQKVYGIGTTEDPMTIEAAALTRGVTKQRGWQIIKVAMSKLERKCQRLGLSGDLF